MSGDSEAKLELTIVSAESVKRVSRLARARTFVVAWVDPRYRQSTNALPASGTGICSGTGCVDGGGGCCLSWDQDLSIRVPARALHSPTSALTLQILSTSLSVSRVVGTAALPVSSVLSGAGAFTLQIWRPSGRAQGLITVSALIVCSGSPPLPACVAGIPLPTALPTAPPIPAEARRSKGSGGGGYRRRSFLIGLVSGAVAAFLVGSASA